MKFLLDVLTCAAFVTSWAWAPPIIGRVIYFIYSRKEHNK